MCVCSSQHQRRLHGRQHCWRVSEGRTTHRWGQPLLCYFVSRSQARQAGKSGISWKVQQSIRTPKSKIWLIWQRCHKYHPWLSWPPNVHISRSHFLKVLILRFHTLRLPMDLAIPSNGIQLRLALLRPARRTQQDGKRRTWNTPSYWHISNLIKEVTWKCHGKGQSSKYKHCSLFRRVWQWRFEVNVWMGRDG